MYTNAVADSVMLYFQHDFYNIIFKIKRKQYIAQWSAPPPPPPQGKILGAPLVWWTSDTEAASSSSI
jgi:hypothetical protein